MKLSFLLMQSNPLLLLESKILNKIMTPTFYASLAGALRGSLLSLKYNRDISSLLDNDSAKLKEFQAIIDAVIERADQQNVKEAVS